MRCKSIVDQLATNPKFHIGTNLLLNTKIKYSLSLITFVLNHILVANNFNKNLIRVEIK